MMNVTKSKTKRPVRFTEEEDLLLARCVSEYSTPNWQEISSHFNNRTKRQVRERWNTYLAPEVNMSQWTNDEDELLVSKINENGFSWSKIKMFFKGRTQMSIKNRWNSHIKSVIHFNSEGRYFLMDHRLKRKQQTRTSKQLERQKRAINELVERKGLMNVDREGPGKTEDLFGPNWDICEDSLTFDMTAMNCDHNSMFINELGHFGWHFDTIN